MLILTENKEATLLRHLCSGMGRTCTVRKLLTKIKALWCELNEIKKKN